MKKTKLICGTCAAICCAMFTIAQAKWQKSHVQDLTMTGVEALSACESIGWWNNNGNCVNNGRGNYFCKTDTWYELTDCKL